VKFVTASGRRPAVILLTERQKTVVPQAEKGPFQANKQQNGMFFTSPVIT
jgi:hypothetical protein